jgi:hypothetical protein
MPEPVENARELKLCPNCCTVNDILAYDSDPESIAPLAGCARCSFTFPLLPGEFAPVTLEAMHRHDCRVANPPENWAGVAQAIVMRVRELGMGYDDLSRAAAQADSQLET